MNVRKNGSVLLVIFLASLFVLSEFSIRYFEKIRSAVDEARKAYISALKQTQVELANQLYEVSHDSVLISDLNSQLSYSISRTLESEIHPGSFDFYVIFDASCKPIAKTLSIPVPPGLCQKEQSNTWQWLSVQNKPLLFLLKSRTDLDKPFFIGAGRFLSESWARSFPGLLSKLELADLKWGSSDKKNLCPWSFCSEFNSTAWIDGRSESGPALASLLSKSKLFPLLRPWLVGQEALENPLAFPVFVLIFALCLLEILKKRFSKTKEDEDKKRFLQWCEHPLNGRVPTPSFAWLEKAQDLLVSVVANSANRCSEFAKASARQEQEIVNLQKRLEESEHKLSEFIPQNILSTHIAYSGSRVQVRFENLVEATADLNSLLEKGILSTNRKLMELVRSWQNGISVRGERSYFRSLYEQKGKEEGETLLRSEVNRLFSFAEQMSVSVMHSVSLARKILEEEAQTSKILENWSYLALKIQDPHLTLNRIGEASAALLQLNSPQRVSFLSNLPSAFTLQLPISTLLGTFFILFSSMKEGVRDTDESLVFQIHKRQKQDQFILALSLTNERGKTLLCHPEEEGLEQVRDLLKPWGMQCQEIHRPEGGSYLVLKGGSSLAHRIEATLI